jgi:hypothetical protein
MTQTNPATGLSPEGIAKVIDFLTEATLGINSATCVYIEEGNKGHQLDRELEDAWMAVYNLKKKFRNALEAQPVTQTPQP